jgi:hypothetical protein
VCAAPEVRVFAPESGFSCCVHASQSVTDRFVINEEAVMSSARVLDKGLSTGYTRSPLETEPPRTLHAPAPLRPPSITEASEKMSRIFWPSSVGECRDINVANRDGVCVAGSTEVSTSQNMDMRSVRVQFMVAL